jgi:hypothetical protein
MTERDQDIQLASKPDGQTSGRHDGQQERWLARWTERHQERSMIDCVMTMPVMVKMTSSRDGRRKAFTSDLHLDGRQDGRPSGLLDCFPSILTASLPDVWNAIALERDPSIWMGGWIDGQHDSRME